MHSHSTPAAIERFWAKVSRAGTDGCWPWIAALSAQGYGQFALAKIRTAQGKRVVKVSAHRLSYFLAYGPFPDDVFVLHDCDNPRCVNPGHLFLGTAADNARAMVAKGRSLSRPGELGPSATLTNDQVCQARLAFAHGAAIVDLALRFGVRPCTMSQIVHGHAYGAVDVIQPVNHEQRARRGERQRSATRTAAAVQQMRTLHAAGSTQRALALRFGVSVRAVQHVLARTTWQHLP